MFLEVMTYSLFLVILGMLLFKVFYTVFSSFKNKFEKKGFYPLSKIKELIGVTECPHNFYCYTSGLDSLCKSEHGGSEPILICLKEQLQGCNFATSSDSHIWCTCPIRSSMVKQLAQH